MRMRLDIEAIGVALQIACRLRRLRLPVAKLGEIVEIIGVRLLSGGLALFLFEDACDLVVNLLVAFVREPVLIVREIVGSPCDPARAVGLVKQDHPAAAAVL